MIDDYLIEQKKAVKILKNSIVNGRNSHAYLFEMNGYHKKIDFALAVAKLFLCDNNYSNNEKCNNCKQCENISKGIHPELKVIEPDGLWIKKEQLSELQKEFSKISINSKNKVYIINNCERMNTQAANSILKFLEEPAPNIIAILLTDNVHQLMDTIVSRCQVITFDRKKSQLKNDYLSNLKKVININMEDDKILEITKNIFDFVNYFETNKIDTILETKKLWHSFCSDKNDLLVCLDIISLIYKDCVNYKIGRNLEVFEEFNDKIELISINNKIETLYNKIIVIIENKGNINYNANSNLLIDKIIIELERCEENE